ncbi:MAG: gliding motility lipoprotein GldH [Prevotella sp.]|jgi:gliding motility-associated lipoprotein GldH|nr:gliding motility lipoprotein GldH [Prevotella sp.]
MRKAFATIALLTAIMANSSCDDNIIYDKYLHTDIRGWGKNEVMEYTVDSINETATYQMALGLRINDTYPFQNLNIFVSQTIYPGNITYTDTVTCRVTDRQGKMKGSGVSLYQYLLPITTHTYEKGDSIRVRVIHNMKREVLPGIADVGIKITKQQKDNK